MLNVLLDSGFQLDFRVRHVLMFGSLGFGYVLVCLGYVCTFISLSAEYKDIRNVSEKDILYTCRTRQHGENKEMTNNYQKEIQTKLTKGLLDMIILQLLDQEPMHGYQLITKIRKSFGVYFGPSTVYPLLATLEKKGYVKSNWNMDSERPRKVYALTNEGGTVLNFTEGALNLICKTMTADCKVRIEAATLIPTGARLQKRTAEFAVF
jgi:PadR family transcriptional regulator, regulatory protein PadR